MALFVATDAQAGRAGRFIHRTGRVLRGLQLLLIIGWTVGVVVSLASGQWVRALVGAAFVIGFGIFALGLELYERAMAKQRTSARS